MTPLEILTKLKQQIEYHFSKSEIKEICFELNLNLDTFSNKENTKTSIIIDLISYLERHNKTPDLINVCKKLRPNFNWDASLQENNTKPHKKSADQKMKIVLCCGEGDEAPTRKLYYRLISDGFQPWMNTESLVGGENLELNFLRQIEECNAILFCVSKESIQKEGFLNKAMHFAYERAKEFPEGKIYIVPVKLNECKLPYTLKNFVSINLFEEKGYEYILRTFSRINSTNI